jgi:hypothetical protein
VAARPRRNSAARQWCGKIGYASKAQAKQAFKAQRMKIDIKHFYRCPHCDLWHLTSQ